MPRITVKDVVKLMRGYGVYTGTGDIAPYRTAMVHRSYNTQGSNERLEFLGDAVLNLAVASYLFERFPDEDEGFLTRMRSQIVNGSTLADICAKLSLNKFILLSPAIEDKGGRTNDKIMEDCLEAFIGAMFIATSYPVAATWVAAVLERHVNVTSLVLSHTTPKDRLAKFCVHKFGSRPTYITSVTNGVFTSSAEISDEVQVGSGSAASRKEAETKAAEDALQRLQVPVLSLNRESTPCSL